MKDGSLQEYIEDIEYMYYETNTKLYGENSVRRAGWLFEENLPDPADLLRYANPVQDVLVADLIIKNENRTWACYIPRIEKGVKAILRHSRKADLDKDE